MIRRYWEKFQPNQMKRCDNMFYKEEAEHKYTNRLIDEKSPYLLQHAHNPVDWFPWGAEAFTKAKREGKPVLVSIGYS